MTNLDSILKSRDITLPTKVHLVKAVVFPVVIHECWTIKKAECWRIDAFELWCWRRLLRVSWTARRSNQSILKEISLEYSLEGLMLKLKLQSFGQLMWRTHSLEKTLILGKIEGKRKKTVTTSDIVSEARLKLKYTFRHHELNRDSILFLTFSSHLLSVLKNLFLWLNWAEPILSSTPNRVMALFQGPVKIYKGYEIGKCLEFLKLLFLLGGVYLKSCLRCIQTKNFISKKRVTASGLVRPGWSMQGIMGPDPWKREWQPTPVFLPGEFHGQRSLVAYSPWGCKVSDMAKRLS